MSSPQRVSPADGQRLMEAFGLLRAGRIAEAASVADGIARRLPRAPDALHLQALCRKAAGDFDGAFERFGAALALAPDDPGILGNCANLLGRLGRHDEAVALHQRIVARHGGQAAAWTGLGLARLDAGDAAGAREALLRATALDPNSANAWHGLGSACRALDALEESEAALRRAVALAPNAARAWISLAVVRRLRGDPADALACCAEARRAGFTGPELEDVEAASALDFGDVPRALAGARRLTQLAPDYVAGHEMLAHILWEHGAALAPDTDPCAAFKAAAESQPDNLPLRHALAKFLVEAQRLDEAIALLRDMQARSDEPLLAAAEAWALSLAGEAEAAERLFARALPALRDNPGFLNQYALHRLKAGDPAAAARHCEAAIAAAPDHIGSLAALGLAWRLLDDPREDWLCGYQRLIAEVEVLPPEDYADPAAFIGDVERTLVAMHKASREPVNQSLRGGSQTAGVLFGRRDPVIAALHRAITRAVEGHIASLPDDPSHPYLRRKAPRIRMSGSWSVRLQSSGRHVNHIHPEGWMSSAFYVTLPPSVRTPAADDTAGCIQFGQPPSELGLDLAPRRVIRPRVGWVALFPSYVWHGTVPFTDAEPRMTVAFDAVPLR